MTTITVNKTLGIDLNPAHYTSPVVIGAGVTLSNPLYPYTVYRHSGATTFFVIGNNGTIMSDTDIGVYLALGGSVTNAASAYITNTNGAGDGVKISGGAGTVINDGSIAAGFHGVDLSFGGSVTNGASAYIAGFEGVYVSGGPGTVVNGGSINGSVRGVELSFGGSVTNGASGRIGGAAAEGGVVVSGRPGTVVNEGSIHSVLLLSGGSVTNASSASIVGGSYGVRAGPGIVVNDGSIEGLYGVYLSADGTLTNAGSIVGSGGTAVAFRAYGGGSNLLVLDPGFAFSGIVSGGTGSGNTALELASTASPGTVTGLGTQFLHFGSIAFDPGARWFASGAQRGLAGPISGFARGDTIELSGYTAIGSSFVTGVLTLDLAGGGFGTLDLPGTFTSASDFVVANVAAGADVTVACFLAGTRILTAAGEVPVNELRFGDRVPTLSGRLARIAFLGHRHVDFQHAHPNNSWPVHVRAGAFGDRLPMRDLMLSPDHAVAVDGVLVPVRDLINGSTIAQELVEEVTYYHVELTAHDVILAEGLPCESYLDTGNRASFTVGEEGETFGHLPAAGNRVACGAWTYQGCCSQFKPDASRSGFPL